MITCTCTCTNIFLMGLIEVYTSLYPHTLMYREIFDEVRYALL